MKTYLIASIVCVNALIAAESRPEFEFRHTTGGAPVLGLANTQRASLTIHGDAAASGPSASAPVFRTAPTDLIAPAATRQKVIRDLQTRDWSPAPETGAATSGAKNAGPIPAAGTDLIGPSSDREKLIRDLKRSPDPKSSPDASSRR